MKNKIKSTHKKFKKDSKNTLYKGFDYDTREKRKKRVQYLQQLSNSLNLPQDVIAGAPIVTATGINEISIENYKGIIEYNGDIIRVLTKVCKISIEGKQLNILYYNDDEMKITGIISGIYYQ
ncbi:MAG TPA: sporulation protein [Clostridiales bacterium]|nr:sporulation protein [Clostridiales bacterium]